jgi:hypothetical protein
MSDTNLLTPCALSGTFSVQCKMLPGYSECVMRMRYALSGEHFVDGTGALENAPFAQQHLLLMVMTHRHTIPLVYYLTPI